MAIIVLRGVITADGKLEINVPEGLPAGPVEIEIRPQKIQGISLGEILDSEVVGMWKDRVDIDDSVSYAEALRKQASRRKNV